MSKSGVNDQFMQMVVNLTPPEEVSKFDFNAGEYSTKGYGSFDKNGTHLITWAIGQKVPGKDKGVE